MPFRTDVLLVIWVALSLGLLVAFYSTLGATTAVGVAKGEAGTMISMETDWGRKYFVCEPTAQGSQPEVLVIEDAHARNVTIRRHP